MIFFTSEAVGSGRRRPGPDDHQHLQRAVERLPVVQPGCRKRPATVTVLFEGGEIILTNNDGEMSVPKVGDRLELDEFVPPQDHGHHDRYARHTHELPDASSEASSRALIRLVPLAYGALLGGLADNLWLGLGVGLILSTAFDVNMGEQSMARTLVRGTRPAFSRLEIRLASLFRG